MLSVIPPDSVLRHWEGNSVQLGYVWSMSSGTSVPRQRQGPRRAVLLDRETRRGRLGHAGPGLCPLGGRPLPYFPQESTRQGLDWLVGLQKWPVFKEHKSKAKNWVWVCVFRFSAAGTVCRESLPSHQGWASLVAQRLKRLPAVRETCV